jgi:general secretion pathway protein E
MLDRYLGLLHRPHGMILVTGPTGCGKTTTLYATLKRIYSPTLKIITLEDPVECHLDGINQFQVNPDIGFSFAHGLRATLRHDPDVIMLGEIRDLDSAEIALRASLTGHLVFSTVHTNDATLAITRLVDMGVPPFLVLSSLLGVMAQRLVRRLCTSCKRPVEPSKAALALLGVHDPPPTATFYEAVGCMACNQLGFQGRTAVYELLCVTPPMRRLTGERLTPGVVRDMAVKEGFISLRESALDKLYGGSTSLEEVVQLTSGEFETTH